MANPYSRSDPYSRANPYFRSEPLFPGEPLLHLVMIVNLNTVYRELATSFHSSSKTDLIVWALWVIFRTVHDRLVSAMSTAICNFLLGLADRFGSKYSKSILVLLRLGLNGIE